MWQQNGIRNRPTQMTPANFYLIYVKPKSVYWITIDWLFLIIICTDVDLISAQMEGIEKASAGEATRRKSDEVLRVDKHIATNNREGE